MRITFLILCLLVSVASVAQPQVQYTQTKAQLEVKRRELMDAIKETENDLERVKNDKKATLAQLTSLQNKLAERQKLSGVINDEMSNIDNIIKSSSKEIDALRQKLELLRVRYAQSIRYAYETRSSYDMLAFIFSSNDFSDAMRRMKYLKKFREFRKKQVDQIKVAQEQLQQKIGILNAEKAKKDELLNTQVQQKQVLVKETDQTNQVMQELKGKEGELMKEIEKNRKIAVRVNRAINDMIEREMAKAAKEAEEKERQRQAAELAKANAAKPAKPTAAETAENTKPEIAPRPRVVAPSKTLLLTPDDIALANNFEGNRGKLYWPVEKGYIIDHFGTHPHPLAPKVMIDNSGIDIQTTDGATVRAVFEGTVSKIFSTVGSQQIVMIKHGNYFTVYNGLSSVSVKVDQHVSTKQAIGQVGKNDEEVPVINFQIWKSNGKKSQVKLNPEAWIGKPR